MDLGDSLCETVQFEIPDLAAAVRLARRLQSQRSIYLHSHKELTVVWARLAPEPDDLVLLLRGVEGWVVEEALRAIRFELDGRIYILEAGEPDWAVAAAA
jgi:hypothetical protein